ncbi:hypothetical protein BBJ28_00005555 [Nothophytophthora sp. Chile5]|nr:hypothetical protein BBJ28_00005555 [Nothophytophthora sp. Chile5]
MSAPIDDLLYGGDDSGDEDEMHTQQTKPATATAVKQAPGSGQQMFQQMFALLKQMLPVEQYATLHSEMRKGNGVRDTLLEWSERANANDIKSIVDIIKRIAGDAIFSSVIQKMDLTRTFPTNTASVQHRFYNVLCKTSPGAKATSAVKPEPQAASVAAALAAAATASSPNASAAVSHSRNEAMEKIMFAKRLLSHASTCSLAHGVCQVKKCDDVRRVFKHSTSCGGANGCSHCEQLKGLVKYHAKECLVGTTDHCTIPFCDGLRRTYAQATAVLAAKAKAAHASAGRAQGGSAAGVKLSAVGSDDDDDNTPLSSAVSKAKKHSKAKSPKNTGSGRGSGGSHNGGLKRKGSNASLTKSNSSTSAATSSSPSSLSAATTPTTTTPTGGASHAAAGAKGGKTNVTANMTQEYGRLLQLILHVEKCKTSACPVGEECAESKALMQQIYSPNAPQVYGHYKTCVAKKNTANCPMCKIGLMPIVISPATSPNAQAGSKGPGALQTSTATPTSAPSASPSSGANKRGSSAVSPTPRSPLKKARSNSTSRSKVATAESTASAASTDPVSQELAQVSVTDIRKEADVLTHTSIELGAERRIMMEGGVQRARMPEQLACKKEEWVEKDLFNSATLRTQMREVGRRSGVELGGQTSEVMSFALHQYLKQVIEEMVEVSKQRGDSYAQTLDALQKKRRDAGGRSGGHLELTATDILRVSCEDSFTKLRQEDLALRSQLLEDAKREEQVEKERAKKRKKVDRSKLTQDERDEAEMDVEELAVKDLKERLLQDDKEGVVKVDGRVNESISAKYAPREADNQVTMEDASYWLVSQKPYIRPKLFVRAEAARIVTKALL